MADLAHLFQLLLLLGCFFSVGITSFWLKPSISFSLHFCFAPLFCILLLFSFEHFVGLGQFPFLPFLLWGWLSWLLWRRPFLVNQLKHPVIFYFLVGFAICFFWRYSLPDISSSEMIPDLDHLVSWSAGTRLPAWDHFAPGERDTCYYNFQYYSAGLIHRALGTTPGFTYHLGYCLVVALGVAGFGEGVRALTRSVWAGSLCAFWICLGGNGTTVITPFMAPNFRPAPVDAMRFIGCYAMQGVPDLTETGRRIVSFIQESPVDTPMEYYSYIIWLGDFHPSLSSLGLLGLTFLAIAKSRYTAPDSEEDRICVFSAVTCTVLMAITNTWLAPLQAALVFFWIVFRFFLKRQDSLWFLAACWFIPLALIFPFFLPFAHDSLFYPSYIEWMPVHPPFLNWLAVMYPAVFLWLLTLLPLFRGECSLKPWAIFIFIAGLFFLGVSLCLHVHDIYGGWAASFNTSLKWWPWIYALLAMSSLSIVWNFSRVTRWLALLILFLTLAANTKILFDDWSFRLFAKWPGPGRVAHPGCLDGDSWFKEDGHDSCTEQILQTLPHGVLLESKMPNSFDSGAGIGLFTGHFQIGAWTGHETIWRGQRDDLDTVSKCADLFYTGQLPDPASWLAGVVPGGVDYVVWLQRDNVDLTIWPKLEAALKDDYDWHASDEHDQWRWGIWIRKNRQEKDRPWPF